MSGTRPGPGPVLPLAGTTVVSLEQAVAAPLATRHLADLGARVVKVERPGAGDFARRYDTTVNGESSYFVWLNRGKESLTLDLKAAEAAPILADLLDGADVFVQNLAPGASGRLGLSADALARSHPEVVVCDISGYGSDGAWADRKAYDLLVQAEVGLLSITGTPDQPARAGISIADIAAGMYAYSAILAALYVRATQGRVQPVEVSLVDALTEWMGAPFYYAAHGGRAPERVGAEHATIAPYGPFVAADGEVFLLAVQNDREWANLCRSVLDLPELVDDPRFATGSARVAHRIDLNARIAARVGAHPADEVRRALDDAGIANAALRSVEELADHPALADRDRWREIATPGGPVQAFVPPGPLTAAQVPMGAVPAIGADTDAILTQLGREAAEIDELRSRGVV